MVYMDLAEEVGESSSPPRSYGSFGGGGSGGGHDVIRNDVYNRLMENGNEEAIGNPDFREQLEAHFNRLPPRLVVALHSIQLQLKIKKQYLDALFSKKWDLN